MHTRPSTLGLRAGRMGWASTLSPGMSSSVHLNHICHWARDTRVLTCAHVNGGHLVTFPEAPTPRQRLKSALHLISPCPSLPGWPHEKVGQACCPGLKDWAAWIQN